MLLCWTQGAWNSDFESDSKRSDAAEIEGYRYYSVKPPALILESFLCRIHVEIVFFSVSTHPAHTTLF